MAGDFGPRKGWLVGFDAVGEDFAFEGREVGGFCRLDVDTAAGSAVRAEESLGGRYARVIDEAQEACLREFLASGGAGAGWLMGRHGVVVPFLLGFGKVLMYTFIDFDLFSAFLADT